jgi:hypothetical protein
MSDDSPYDWLDAPRDLRLLLALREARQNFFERLVRQASEPETLAAFAKIHEIPIFHVAEFFYALRATKLETPETITKLVELHNADLDDRLDREAYKHGGLAARLEKGKFKHGPAAAIIDNLGTNRGVVLNLSDITRFLIEAMSAETTKQAVQALCKAKLLECGDGKANRSAEVWSTGRLEGIYGQYLAEVRAAARAIE